MSRDVRNWLPASEDGVMHLRADKTRKDKRGRKHPLGLVTRESAHAPSHFDAMCNYFPLWLKGITL